MKLYPTSVHPRTSPLLSLELDTVVNRVKLRHLQERLDRVREESTPGDVDVEVVDPGRQVSHLLSVLGLDQQFHFLDLTDKPGTGQCKLNGCW